MTRASSNRCRFCPRFDALEDRALLATCTVTNLLDVGRGGMSIGSGQVSGDLRFCINHTNNLPGHDTIGFAVQGTIQLNRALPDLDGDLTMTGPGVDLLSINARQKASVLYVEEDISVEISGLTLTGGRNNDGGGIYNEGTLTLQDCSVTGNTLISFPNDVHRGGGIYNEGILSISSCSVSGNTFSTIYARGGAIYNAPGATLTVESSIISDNVTGGGFSTVPQGVGVYNAGTATITSTIISANRGNKLGVSTFAAEGGGIYNSGQLLVDSSLISGNEISGDYWAFGGGIYNHAGTATIVNSTITGNLAFANGDTFGASRGGGIDNVQGGTVVVRHSTIARNHSFGLQSYVTGNGGGISNVDSVLHMHNTILSGNEARNAGHDLSGTLASSGYNVFENSAGGNGYEPTDLLDVNPRLGPLANNGGPTLTHSLLPGSPAIDAGDNTEAPEWDQRGPGFPRVVNGTTDIGAFEVQSTLTPRQRDFYTYLITAECDRDERD